MSLSMIVYPRQAFGRFPLRGSLCICRNKVPDTGAAGVIEIGAESSMARSIPTMAVAMNSAALPIYRQLGSLGMRVTDAAGCGLGGVT